MVETNDEVLAVVRQWVQKAENDLKIGTHTLELLNLWQTAQLIAQVSRERRESRGPHHRKDYPEPDSRYAGSYLIELKDQPAPGERLQYTTRLVNLTEV